jgi:pilus assembly protein Flp/PilA
MKRPPPIEASREIRRLLPVGKPRVGMPHYQELHMSKAWKLVRRLGNDEEGAALIEYTVLLGILVVAVIATIVAVGVWVNGKWHTLQQSLS